MVGAAEKALVTKREERSVVASPAKLLGDLKSGFESDCLRSNFEMDVLCQRALGTRFCQMTSEQANKALEPTPGLVTSRASARLAPIPVVAHL